MPTPNYIDVLPLNTRILQLPFIGLQDPIVSAQIYMQLLDEFPEMRAEAEGLGIKILGATPLGRYDLKLIDQNPVRVPADLAGRTIVPYKLEFLPMLEKYNAAGSFIPPAQIYEALERGVVDGYIATWAFAGFFGLTDLIHQHVDFGDFGAFQEMNLFAMSLSTWNELPPDLQEALMNVTWNNGGYQDIYYGDTEVLANNQRSIAEGKGDLITILRGAEIDPWRDYILPLHQATIDDINEIRGDEVAQRIYDRVVQLLAQHFG
jgi:TRAP-type C4-dicarboxylate transport system substrate-binding protein